MPLNTISMGQTTLKNNPGLVSTGAAAAVGGDHHVVVIVTCAAKGLSSPIGSAWFSQGGLGSRQL